MCKTSWLGRSKRTSLCFSSVRLTGTNCRNVTRELEVAIPVAEKTNNIHQGECDECGRQNHHEGKPWVEPGVHGLRPYQETLSFEVGEEERQIEKRESTEQNQARPHGWPPAN